MTRLFYDEKKTTTVVYTYSVNCGGSYNLKSHRGKLQLVFENGKLVMVKEPEEINGLRNRWRLNGAIDEIIERLIKEHEASDYD